MRLFCTASTLFPDVWQGALVNEQVLLDATEFALHARRLNELCGLRSVQFPSVAQTRYTFTAGHGVELIADYHEALNRLVHARELAIGWAVWEGQKVFLAHDNLSISYIKIRTDRLSTGYVSVFGLATCFLNDVMGKLRHDGLVA